MDNRIKKIAESYKKAKNRTVQDYYKPAQEWAGQVDEKTAILNAFIQNNDYDGLEKILQNFLADSSLSKGLFNVPNNYSIIEYEAWKKNNPMNEEKIVAPTVGNPAAVFIGDFCLDEKGLMSLQFNHRITWGTLRFQYFAEKTMNLFNNIEKPLVVEIGGGFGGFAYSLLGKKKNMIYVNFDLPEMLILSSYYLMELFPDKKFLLYDKYDQSTNIDDYDIVLLPNFEFPSLKDESVDVFLNFRSMSETTMAALQNYLGHIGRTLKYGGYLFHENEGVELIVTRNNIQYKRVLCYDFPIPKCLEEISVIKSKFYDRRYFECLYKKVEAKYPPILIETGNNFNIINEEGNKLLRSNKVFFHE
ncbi:MAG: putative sugar O-methyltransferase [bacterium]